MKYHFHEKYASFTISFGYKVFAYHHTAVQSKVGGRNEGRFSEQMLLTATEHLLSAKRHKGHSSLPISAVLL